eukprot:TRINITY_DN35066_c0_g1_i1.p1 TRINITY_DN35066_c0_g1~~TRINITY_DN35066_c0_g1_i1.p1  ORF type:complete len:218 (+),score=27.79 TRINITY_DN35066_c0_g1_i1:55-654(+)
MSQCSGVVLACYSHCTGAVMAFLWGDHEGVAAKVEGARFTKTSDDPDDSMALSQDSYTTGVHEFRLRKISGDGSCCCIGVIQPGANVAESMAGLGQDVFAAFYCDDGLLVAKPPRQKWETAHKGLSRAFEPNAELILKLDCSSHTLSVSACGDDPCVLTGLADGPLHLFVCIDDPEDAWEVVQYQSSLASGKLAEAVNA